MIINDKYEPAVGERGLNCCEFQNSVTLNASPFDEHTNNGQKTQKRNDLLDQILSTFRFIK